MFSMSSEIKAITAAERFCDTLSEISGFVDTMKKTFDFFAGENHFRAVLDGLLSVFGNTKGPVSLRIEDDKTFAVWEGLSRKCKPGFFVIAETGTAVLLYQDGKATELSPNATGAIYPFSSTPQQKSFLKPRVASTAKIVCVPESELFRIRWGTPTPLVISDDATQQIRKGVARGQLYLAVADGKLLYEKLLCHIANTKDELQDYLRDIFVNDTKLQLFRIFKKMSAEATETPDLEQQLALAEEFYQATSDTFKAYGIEMNEITKHSILMSSTLQSTEPKQAPTGSDGDAVLFI